MEPAPPEEESPVDRALRRLAGSGALVLGEAPEADAYVRSPLQHETGTGERLLDEERGEG